MFIVLESIDGGGKGRQRVELVEFLKKKDVNVQSVEFPDHTTVIWDKYIHPALHGELDMVPGAWFSAFAFEKFLWDNELKKYKEDTNNLFIADGYYTTTLAYQCILQEKPSLEFGVQFAEEFGIVKPDLTIYLDVHPKTALARKENEEGKEGDEGKDLFEASLEKQKEVRGAFQQLANDNVWCDWAVVDGNGSIQEVRDAVFAEIHKVMKW